MPESFTTIRKRAQALDNPGMLIAGDASVPIAKKQLQKLTVPERGTSTRGKQTEQFAAGVDEFRKHLSVAFEKPSQLVRETSPRDIYTLNRADGQTRPFERMSCSAGTPGVETMLAFRFDVSGEKQSFARNVESGTLLLQHLSTSGAK